MATPFGFKGQVVLDPVKVAGVLRGPQGMVLRRLIEDAHLVKAAAQIQVGVYEPTPGDRRKRKPGTLRDSIVTRIMPGSTFPTVRVGTDDPIALMHHEGTVPHPIVARRAPLLVFYWRKVGRVVAFKRVNHPGTEPNRFLTDSLKVLVTRYR